MESAGHDSALADENGIGAVGGQHLNIVSCADDLRSADKDHLQGLRAEFGFGMLDGTLKLPSVGIAADTDIEHTQRLLRRILDLFGQKDGSGTGAEGRFHADKMAEFFKK